MPAEWEHDGESYAVSFTAASLREAYSPALVVVAAAIGAAGSATAALAGAGVVGAVLTGILLGGLLLAFLGYLRLAAQAREVTLVVSAESVSITDQGTRMALPLHDIDLLLLVLDGAPARLALRAGGVRFAWTIGNLHRNNTVERYIAEMPVEADRWLTGAGLSRSTKTQRGVTRIEYRRPSA